MRPRSATTEPGPSAPLLDWSLYRAWFEALRGRVTVPCRSRPRAFGPMAAEAGLLCSRALFGRVQPCQDQISWVIPAYQALVYTASCLRASCGASTALMPPAPSTMAMTPASFTSNTPVMLTPYSGVTRL